jgi:hypothetical protein
VNFHTTLGQVYCEWKVVTTTENFVAMCRGKQKINKGIQDNFHVVDRVMEAYLEDVIHSTTALHKLTSKDFGWYYHFFHFSLMHR